jgi:hypothetical protein
MPRTSLAAGFFHRVPLTLLSGFGVISQYPLHFLMKQNDPDSAIHTTLK